MTPLYQPLVCERLWVPVGGRRAAPQAATCGEMKPAMAAIKRFSVPAGLGPRCWRWCRASRLARSGIGLAVRAGACKPEVGTAEAPTRALLACRSIAISTSASGIYLDKLFARLAIDGALSAKIIPAEVTPMGELLPVAGIELCRAAAGPRARDDLILRRRGGRLAGRGGRAGAYRLPRRAGGLCQHRKGRHGPGGEGPEGLEFAALA